MSDKSKMVSVLLRGENLDSEYLAWAFSDLKTEGIVHDDGIITIFFMREEWEKLGEEELLNYLTQWLETDQINKLDISVEDAIDGDWVAKWRNRLGPIKCGQHFYIVPPVVENFTSGEEDIVLGIEPRMAFGTGEHATTRMALNLLETCSEKTGNAFKRVLDLGCGNGVLALGALLINNECTCEAIDNEEEAVEETADNARKHGVAERINVKLGDALDPQLDGEFDLIFANILLNPLLEGLEIWTKQAHKGTYIIMTGVLAKDESIRLEKHAASLDWNLEANLVEGDWYCGMWILK